MAAVNNHQQINNPLKNQTKTFTLDNGLQVVLIPNHMAPVVSVALIYKVGTADDPHNLVGISHFLEHMMFKGTKNTPSGEFTKTIMRLGGECNAWTYYDETVYDCIISAKYLEDILKLEADRMVNLSFTKEEVESEKKVVMEERLMRTENDPFGTVLEAYLRSTFWYHPYGIPPIGYPHHIQAYNYDDVLKHYKKWYAPNNAILLVVGDVTTEQLRPLAEKYFASIKPAALPERVRIAEPDHKGICQHIEQSNPRNSVIHLWWVFQAPCYRSVADKNLYFALQVLAEAIAGTETRSFYRHMVEEKKIAISVDANYQDDSIDPKGFYISVTMQPDGNVKLAKDEIQQYVNHLIKNGIDEKELANAKRDLIAGLAFARDGHSALLEHFYKLAIGHTVEEIESWADKIAAVTVEDVKAAAAMVLNQGPIVTVDLYPQKQIDKTL